MNAFPLIHVLIPVGLATGLVVLDGWRRTYLLTAFTALYLNFFVLVAQLFQHTPALHALAQGLFLLLFVVLGFAAVRGFRATSPA